MSGYLSRSTRSGREWIAEGAAARDSGSGARTSPARGPSWWIALALVGVAAAVYGLGGIAKATIAGAPLLEDGKTAVLSGLQYGADFKARVRSIRLELEEGEEQDPVVGQWVLTGSNSSGNPHLVDLNVRLVTEKGKRLSSSRKKAMLKPGTESQEIVIEFEIQRKKWDQAHHLQIQADFRVH